MDWTADEVIAGGTVALAIATFALTGVTGWLACTAWTARDAWRKQLKIEDDLRAADHAAREAREILKHIGEFRIAYDGFWARIAPDKPKTWGTVDEFVNEIARPLTDQAFVLRADQTEAETLFDRAARVSFAVLLEAANIEKSQEEARKTRQPPDGQSERVDVAIQQIMKLCESAIAEPLLRRRALAA